MIPLMKNTFINEFETKKELCEFILKNKIFSMGEKCAEFEKKFSEYQCRNNAVLFNSGGSANLALLQALKNLGYLKEGDKVGFSALTWSTNVMPIIQIGLEPIVIDCNPETLNVMSEDLEKRIKQVKLNAFFITNALGFSGDLDKIRDLCKKNKIILLEDNCESLGTVLPAGKTGNFGLASTFSFFVAHHMSTIEGGMVCTDDEELAEMLKIVRANGWDRNLSATQQIKWRHKYNISNEFEAKYAFYDLGFNFRPTEITGFLGISQLKMLEKNIQVREQNYLLIEKTILKNPELIAIKHKHIQRMSPFGVPVLTKSPELRKFYVSQFAGAGIEIRPMIAGNIQKQPFYVKYVKQKADLPGTDFVHDCGFYCGNYPELTDSDLETMTSCLVKY